MQMDNGHCPIPPIVTLDIILILILSMFYYPNPFSCHYILRILDHLIPEPRDAKYVPNSMQSLLLVVVGLVSCSNVLPLHPLDPAVILVPAHTSCHLMPSILGLFVTEKCLLVMLD